MSEINAVYLRKLLKTACVNGGSDDEAVLVESVRHILANMERLCRMDVKGVEPMHLPNEQYLQGKTVWRKDEPGTCVSQDQLRENAPSFSEGFFTVPKVID